MKLLRFTRSEDDKIAGILNWFPTHGTAMYRNNTHVAGDNKALAAWMVEQNAKSNSQCADDFIAGTNQSNLGDEVARPKPAYTGGGRWPKVTFHGANPRNNLRLGGTYAALDKKGSDGTWKQVRDDADWFLVLTWRKTSVVLGRSQVDIECDTAGNA
ncbi:hypothetical protein LLEC1_00261 [Akanthomyces lecanii]|uniref:Neutral/alkaline non-lysosomal ceramidase C-terminal domain-containing protein n=1 Tax=Cordyceps confragosa TaxID=2714763 RepID=A0A179I2S9_CORDF|nr:hypothetical protein LLEC1_00261 [Akanthomyces lecanii]